MKEETIFNKALNVYEDNTAFDNLILIKDLIGLLTDEIGLALENTKDIKTFNTLSTCLLNINEIIKENKRD